MCLRANISTAYLFRLLWYTNLRMDFDHLKLFVDIVRERSVTRGAQLNGITQSAASQHLQQLEKSFGLPLLDRKCRPPRLTEAGRLYYNFCREVLRRKEELEAALDQLRQRIQTTVRVASIYSIGISELNDLEREFRSRYPEADLVVEYLRPEKVYEAVLDDQVDIGLISYPSSSREIRAIHWRDERMVVVVRPDHPLAQQTSVTPQDLQDEELVGFDQDLPISRSLARYFRKHGVQPKLILHFDNVVAIKEAVELGTGISILPEPAVREDVRQGRICAVPLYPEIYRPVGVIYRKGRPLSGAVHAFLDLLLRPRSPAPDVQSPPSKGTLRSPVTASVPPAAGAQSDSPKTAPPKDRLSARDDLS